MLTMLLACLFLLAAVLLLALCAYAKLFPMNRIRSLEDVGYAHVAAPAGSNRLKRNAINRLRANRKKGKIPPPYPNGWYVVAESRELKRGDIKEVAALGKTWAVFRLADSGKACVTDPYCPHLGANLTAGGVVEGDCVKCPFHMWSFHGETGLCENVPNSEKIPKTAMLKTYHSVEVNQLIYVWYHVDDAQPEYELQSVPQLNPDDANFARDGWVYQGRSEYEVSCHIQDISENGADPAHLPAVHKTSILAGGEPTPWLDRCTQGLSWHDWDVRWNPCEDDGQKHKAVVRLRHAMQLCGVQMFSLDVVGTQIGPSLVHLNFANGLFGDSMMIQYVVPVEPMLQKIVHVFHTQRSFPALYAQLVLWGESILVERDIRVWNSKTYPDQPLLVKEDHLIKQHRRWFTQFYSENSRTVAQTNDTNLDW